MRVRAGLGPRDAAPRDRALRAAPGLQLQPRDIVATNSCLESITLCLRAVTKPGDIVALESPTYFGFLEILQSLHLRALEIPTHPRDGLSLDALELALDTQPVKALLISPTLSNPMGGSLPTAERKRLARMVSARGIAMIEDVLHNDLAEQEDKRRAVRSFDPTGHVMLCGSFSKTIAPGLRVGWVEAGRWSEPVRRMKMATSGAQTTFVELAMAELLGHTGNEAGFRQMRHTDRRARRRGAPPDRGQLSQRHARDRPGRRLRAVGRDAARRRLAGAVHRLPSPNASRSRRAPCSAPATATATASGWASAGAGTTRSGMR